MLRWILLLVVLGGIYWIYQRDYAHRDGHAPASSSWTTTAAGPTLPPGGRLGGGLNPFVTDDGVDTAPQRPKAP
jgi:hypothetical protein